MKLERQKNNSITKPRYLYLLYAVLCLLAVTFALKLSDAFILFPDQEYALSNLSAEFTDGHVLIHEIYPRGQWDVVCILPKYAFSVFDGHKESRKYLGSGYFYNIVTSPNTHSRFYGVGFAFLKDNKLQKFINLQPVELDFFTEGKLFNKRGHFVTVPDHQVGTKTLTRLFFANLNITFQDKGRYCYPRDTAYIEFNNYQTITIGG